MTIKLNAELELLYNVVFKPLQLQIFDIKAEGESQHYGAQTFKINQVNLKFRVAKITPTKLGQFVTFWSRNNKGITEPLSINDDFNYYIVVTKNQQKRGVFIFPKKILLENKILSGKDSCGKRGIRVYPSWDIPESKQAQKTQLWQLNYFLKLSNSNADIGSKVLELLSLIV